MAHSRVIVVGLSIVMLAFTVHSFWQKSAPTTNVPQLLFGVPTYPGAKLNIPMSGSGEPYIFVFLTTDSLEKVLKFYDQFMSVKRKTLSYGKSSLTIYQYLLQKGELVNYLSKGVEIMAYNAFFQRVLKMNVKIKIYIPREEVGDSQTPLDQTAPAGGK